MRAPSFSDGKDTAPLDDGDASWHGPGTRRHMAVAVVLVVAAAAAAVALMAFTDGSGTGPSVSDPGGTAVQPDDGVYGPVDDVPDGTSPDQPPAPDPGNVTLPAVPTLPGVPTLPAP